MNFYDVFSKLSDDPYVALSQKLEETGVQDSACVRNNLLTRELAIQLIDDDGKLKDIPLEEFQKKLYILGPGREHDGRRQELILRVLKRLKEDKAIVKQLEKIHKPFRHQLADQVIRDTLDLPANEKITDAHARRACLAAWMCFLRQNVGSCFATAPAILVHNEQPEQFLKDLAELLATGRIKRTFAGVEYSVPFSSSWGTGDLKKPLFVQKGFSPDFWKAPGIKKALPNIEKVMVSDEPQFITSAEEMIKKALLKEHNLTEEDLEAYENRPQPLRPTALTAPAPTVSKGMEQFVKEFSDAKRRFKILAENALLKTWEYSIASFAETKADFTRWNLYSSLGFRPEDQGGIGEKVYGILKEKVDSLNRKVEDLQFEYEQAHVQLQGVESRMKRAASEDEVKWLKIEYQNRVNEFRSIEEMRNTAHNQAKRVVNLYEVMLDHYYTFFQNYFQEVYDADMRDVRAGPFDDSPAGFRLLYKHGRDNTSLWTKIRNQHDYIESLVAFFTATEIELRTLPELEGMESIIGEVVTAIVNHIQTPEFLETAFYRMARAHNTPLIKDPLNNLDKIQKKPWVYTSGGVMNTLVSCYFRREEKPTDVDRWVESPTELLVFLIDTLKDLRQIRRSFIMHSPTHAFLLKPYFEPFHTTFQNKEFSYTWARDKLIAPMQHIVFQMKLSPDMINFLLGELKKRVPFPFSTVSNLYGEMSPKEFRKQIDDRISGEVDSLLYSSLPLFKSENLGSRLEEIFQELKLPNAAPLIEKAGQEIGRFKILTAKDLFDISRAIVCELKGKAAFSENWHQKIIEVQRKLHFALPKPIIFADSNWERDLFAFVVNPGTEELELWRVDELGFSGHPMAAWKKWLDGSCQKPTWGIFTRPNEYTA